MVTAPYEGCFSEPNIFLCTPPNCDLHDKMNYHDTHGDRLVWRLYSSGQGMCVDCLISLSDIVMWLAEQSISDLATREGRDSEHAKEHYGAFDSFQLHDFGPIDELPASETYWAQAVRAAEKAYNVTLPWTCVQCETVHEGTGESEQEPIHTGYRGNGGVGVFMQGAICYECFNKGLCVVCEETGYSSPHDVYSEEVVEYSLHLCEYCLEGLFQNAVTYEEGWDDKLDAEDVVPIIMENNELAVRYPAKEGVRERMHGVKIDMAVVTQAADKQPRLNLYDRFKTAQRVSANALSQLAKPVEED